MSLQGEWWIDDSGYATFADGDIGDQNHATIAFQSALGIDLDEVLSNQQYALERITEYLNETDISLSAVLGITPVELLNSLVTNINDILTGHLTETQILGLMALGADAKFLNFIRRDQGDVRTFMMLENAWIRVDNNNFQLWNLDDEALGRIRDFVANEYPEDEDPLEDEFEIEELRKGGMHLSVSGSDLLESGKSADTLKYSAQRERTGMYNPPEFNDAFWRWFWGSKVVDENGDPLVVYHATTGDFSEFVPGGPKPTIQFWPHKGMHRSMIGSSGRPFWFATSPENIPAAHHYAAGKKGANIMPVYLSIRNPLIVDADTRKWAIDVFAEGHKDFPMLVTEEAYRNLQNNGYDGVFHYYLDRTLDSGYPDEIVALDPRQIKSATGNRGTWDPRDPDITHNPPKVFRVKSTKLFFRPEHDE